MYLCIRIRASFVIFYLACILFFGSLTKLKCSGFIPYIVGLHDKGTIKSEEKRRIH